MTRLFLYHPRTKPIPPGWRFFADFGDSHHAEHSILIEKIK